MKTDANKERLFKALLLIEDITVHEMDLPKYIKTEKEKQLHDAICLIYEMAHIARVPSCMDKHTSWEKKFHELCETHGVTEAVAKGYTISEEEIIIVEPEMISEASSKPSNQ